MNQLKHSKKFFFRIDPRLQWNKRTRTLRVSGWCIAIDGTLLTAIRARLPEIFAAPLDRERPEIAKNFSNVQNSAPCGFVLDLKVPKQAARLAFDAADAKGNWQQIFFTTINGPVIAGIDDEAHWQELNAPMCYEFFFDHPTRWNEPTRVLYIVGWCVDRTGAEIQAIRARAGSREFPANYGIERSDVAKYLPNLRNAQKSGFSIAVPVPKRAVDLKFDVRSEGGEWQQFFSQPIPARSKTATPEQLLPPPNVESLFPGTTQKTEFENASTRYEFFFDHPTSWTEPRRILYVAGWCVDRTGAKIQAMRARAGSKEFPANFGIERPDVAQHFSDSPGAAKSGFSIAIPVPTQPVDLKLDVLNEEGEWQQFFAQPIPSRSRTATPEQLFAPPDVEFLVPDTTEKSRFRFWFDLPRDWSKKLRYLRVEGWCVAMAGEPITELRGRIGKKIFPARYGIRRPDVAKAVGKPEAFCCALTLSVVVPRRPVTFALEARAGDGLWETFFQYRICGPIFPEASDIQGELSGDYATWIRKYDRLMASDRRQIRNHIAQFAQRPLISVLLPTYNSDLRWLQRAVDSVRRQLYPVWELCIADDASTDEKVGPAIEKFARRDPRIKIMRRARNGGIAATSNDALRLATGNYIALLDHDDELAPTALYFVALELNRDPHLQLLYSDEDKLDPRGRRYAPHFKPDWSPDLFLSQNYISHLSVFDIELIRKVGGFREGFEGAQDYDLMLRCIEQIDPARIAHIPRVLYHWRAVDSSTAAFAEAKPDATRSAVRAVQEHLSRRNVSASVESHRMIYQRVKYKLPDNPPLVSIILPTRDRVALLRICVHGILEKTDYPNYEIIIIDNESSDPETRKYLDLLGKNERITVCEVSGEFNYSRLNNRGVAIARGSLVVLLNNDIEIIDGGWLSEMVSQSLRSDVGAVGALLRYPDQTFQHAGIILGAGGVAGHAYSGTLPEEGYFSRPHLTQNLSAVTAACALIKRNAYLAIGGFDEVNVPVAFNDVDFCLRLRQAGFQIIWTPHAELYHHESASRGYEDTLEKQTRFLGEINYMYRKWGSVLQSDPFYNPNLSLGEYLFVPAFPPRLTKPWLTK